MTEAELSEQILSPPGQPNLQHHTPAVNWTLLPLLGHEGWQNLGCLKGEFLPAELFVWKHALDEVVFLIITQNYSH